MATSLARAIVVYVSVPSKEVGSSIAKALVERRLAACVAQMPDIMSTYRWEGKIEQSQELLLMIKTAQDQTDSLVAAVKELHPYDVPEIIATPVIGGSEEYIQWVQDETRQ